MVIFVLEICSEEQIELSCPGVVSNELSSLSIVVWVPLSVPHKHVKYLKQGLIEVEVYNVVFFNGCYRIEKGKCFKIQEDAFKALN